MTADLPTHLARKLWHVALRVAQKLREIHDEQVRLWETLWQMNRVPVGQAGSLRWTQSLDGLRLTGGYLPAPDEAIARDSR
jgi:hypothetical protein